MSASEALKIKAFFNLHEKLSKNKNLINQ